MSKLSGYNERFFLEPAEEVSDDELDALLDEDIDFGQVNRELLAARLETVYAEALGEASGHFEPWLAVADAAVQALMEEL